MLTAKYSTRNNVAENNVTSLPLLGNCNLRSTAHGADFDCTVNANCIYKQLPELCGTIVVCGGLFDSE